jgi:Domain of unknown function (DUF4091)/Family of unknown function (DUF6067)
MPGIFMMLSACSQMAFSNQNDALGMPLTWVTSGLDRIGLTEPPGTSRRIELSAAKGEYEPFQIGIRSAQTNLTNVKVTVSDLQGPNQQKINNTNITLYREDYVYVSTPSPTAPESANPSLGAGWYADGLIPFNNPNTNQDLVGAAFDAVPFNVAIGQNQPIWVDVLVPRDAVAGDYTGTYQVTSDQGESSGEIALKVWDFELPLKPSLQSSFHVWQDNSKATMVELLKHKVMPVADFDPADERELIDQWGLNFRRLPFWSGADVDSPTMTAPPSIDQIKASAAQHQSDLPLYVFPADEISNSPQLFEPLKQWSRHIHQAGLPNLVTIAPTPELYDDGSGTGRSAVDIWTVLPKMYDAAPNEIAQVRQKGDQVWSYNALVQDDYSPKWQIDFAPINYRMQPGFISQSLGLTGILYWRVDLWTNDPWNDVQTTVQGSNHYPGDGMLVYPGAAVGLSGVVPSIRLKAIREGVEDYEYVQILKNLGRGDWAIAQSQTVGRDWRNWSQDPDALAAVRQTLGEEIERITRTSNL